MNARKRAAERYWERLRLAATVLPSDIHALRSRSGPLRPSVVGLAALAAEERELLVEAVGGEDASAQQRMLAADIAELGMVKRALLLMFARTEEPETASRIATLATARRASLQALGLQEHRREEDIQDYLRRQESASENEGQPSEPIDDAEETASADAGGVTSGSNGADNPAPGPVDDPASTSPQGHGSTGETGTTGDDAESGPPCAAPGAQAQEDA